MEQKIESLGERIKKNYEDRTRYMVPRRSYTILRLDGRSFHQYVEHIGSVKPYDIRLMSRMDLTTRFLCSNIQGAQLAYVASDEISILITDFTNKETSAWFDGNIQKMASVSASMAGAFFNSIPDGIFGSKPYSHVEAYKDKDVNDWVMEADRELAFFDARVFTIPDRVEVENYIRWRIKDWERNSLHMLARKHFTQKELNGKGWSEVHLMTSRAGDDWSKLLPHIKRGRMCSRHIGGMWNIYDAPDFSDPEARKSFQEIIPNPGYE